MELLITVHFVALHPTGPADADSIAAEVARWSERKRNLFSTDDLRTAWRQLHKASLLGEPR